MTTSKSAPVVPTRVKLSLPIAIGAALALAVIHLVLAPQEMAAETYMGVLFYINTALFVLVAVALAVPSARQLGWLLGVLVSAGTFLGYVLSRTTGLPGGYKQTWHGTPGTVSLILEVAFIAAAAAVFATTAPGRKH